MVDKVTMKQKLFAEHFVANGRNGTQAAISAGYAKNSADVTACKLLGLAKIQAYITELCKESQERLEISQDMITAELAKIAFSNVGNYLRFNQSGVELVDSESIKPEHLACISEVTESVTQHGGTTKFKLHDKVKALQLLGNDIGMFNEKEPVVFNNVTV